MKMLKLLTTIFLLGSVGIALANPYQQEERARARAQYNYYQQQQAAFQDNRPVQMFLQGSMGFGSNFADQNDNYCDYYNDCYSVNQPNQYGFAAGVQFGVLFNISPQFVLGPTVGYNSIVTNSNTQSFGSSNTSYGMKYKTTVPPTQFGLLAGVKFSNQFLAYIDMWYATGGKQNVEISYTDKNSRPATYDININLNQPYFGFGARYNFQPNLYVGAELDVYNIFNTDSYQINNLTLDTPDNGKITFSGFPIYTSVSTFNITFGMNF